MQTWVTACRQGITHCSHRPSRHTFTHMPHHGAVSRMALATRLCQRRPCQGEGKQRRMCSLRPAAHKCTTHQQTGRQPRAAAAGGSMPPASCNVPGGHEGPRTWHHHKAHTCPSPRHASYNQRWVLLACAVAVCGMQRAAWGEQGLRAVPCRTQSQTTDLMTQPLRIPISIQYKLAMVGRGHGLASHGLSPTSIGWPMRKVSRLQHHGTFSPGNPHTRGACGLEGSVPHRPHHIFRQLKHDNGWQQLHTGMCQNSRPGLSVEVRCHHSMHVVLKMAPCVSASSFYCHP